MAEPITVRGALDLSISGQRLAGERQMALLAAVQDTGSISQAARAVGMSYKAAWDAVDAMNQLAGEPLVERVAGGRGGGGTRLTPRGQQLLRNFHQIEQEHQRFVQALTAQADHLADDYLLMRKLTMKTSARNQFSGTVRAVNRGAVNDEVVLALAGGHEIVAVITHGSAQALGLEPGKEALALVKASSVLLATDLGDTRVSARNVLHGTVSRVHPGAVNAEVVLELPGGLGLAAVVTQASVQALQLQPGQPATALFKASSVLLAVPA